MSDFRQKEKSIQEAQGTPSSELTALALKGAQDGIWDLDAFSGRIYFCPQWKALVGYGPNDLSDNPDEWFSRVHPDDIENVKKALKMHCEGETAHFRNEHRIRGADGVFRWVLMRGMALKCSDKRSVRVVGTMTSIDKRKQSELQTMKQLDELRFALASEKVLMEELDRKNKELVELSITDGLTGLYNHRFLQERFDFEFKRVRRYGGNLSCLLLDIDNFKLLNDTYGHQFGDYVLRQLSSIIRTRSREVDICGRYGGEEFMVISSLRSKNALQYAIKLHNAIECYVFKHPTADVKVTVSIGIAEYTEDLKTKQELIERADRAMYQAKKDGRNLVRLWKEVDLLENLAVDRYGISELKEKFQDLSSQMRAAYMESTNVLVRAVDSKDPYAQEHSANVSKIAVAMAQRLHMRTDEIDVVRYAALLHDIGKISVQDSILGKRDALTEKEMDLLKRHPEVGVNILKDVHFLEKEIPIILYHHERFDGTGYPHGLKGFEIPIGARIVAVADAYDSMISGRTYKKSLSPAQAREELVSCRGKQFSPDAVDAFMAIDADDLPSKNKCEINRSD